MFWLGVLVLLFSQKCYGLILNETEYHRMPPLFALDEYYSCLRQPNGTYCLAKLDLFSDQPSELMHMIQNYTKYSQRIRFNHTYIEHGVCVTKTCEKYIKDNDINKNEDLERVIEACVNQTIWEEYNLQTRLSKIRYCDRQDETREVDANDWAVLAIFISIVLLCLSATIFHYRNIDNPKVLQEHKYLLCFSFIYNWRFSNKYVKDERMARLEGLNGIRFSGSMTMVSGHVLWIISMGFVDNVWDHEQAYYNNLHLNLMFNAMTVVQIFFVLSGFLFIYKLLIDEEKGGPLTWNKIPMMCVKRLWRFIPSLLALLLFSMTWLRHMGSGPLWQRHVGSVVRDCRKYWWAHLLFINNYIPDDKHCQVQTWHLAADVQLFFLAVIVYMVTRRGGRKLTLAVLAVISMLLPALHIWWYDLDAHMLKTPEFLRTLDYDTFWRSYIVGHNNMGCFVQGMFTAIKLYEWQKAGVTFQNSKAARILFWMAEPMTWMVYYSGTLFFDEGGRYSLAIRMLYQAILRVLYGSFVVVLVLGIVMKVDKLLTSVMEWRVWRHYAQLSFSIYLVHMNLVHVFSGTRTNLVHFSYFDLIVYYSGIWLMSVILAFLLHMLLETPMNSLFEVATRKNKEVTTGTKDAVVQTKTAAEEIKSTTDQQDQIATQVEDKKEQ